MTPRDKRALSIQRRSTMFRNRRVYVHLAWIVAWIGLAGLVLSATAAADWQSEADLLATLTSEDAPYFDKTIACKELAVVGTEAAVPVLANLLSDEKLSHYARYALEPNPSAKVDEVLANALSTLKGRYLIGTIQSIANRGKPEAIGLLAGKLDDADGAVATAAAHGIARLGTPQAAEILGKAAAGEFAAARLVCGKTLAAQGHTDEAVAMLAKLSETSEAAKHVRLAAMLQAVDLQQSEGIEMLARALASDDKDVLNTALRTARLVEPAVVSKAIAAAMRDGLPAGAAPLVTLLGDLGDPAGLPVVVKAAKSDDEAARIAALEALATLGNADHVPLLIDAALDESQPVSARAEETLAGLAGDKVDRAVLELLDDAARQSVAIRLIGRRRITSAVPKLLALLDGPQRLDVVGALGETVSLEDLDALGKLLGSESEELRTAVHGALNAACGRMPQRDATAAKLAGYLPGASEPTVEFVMDQLRKIGGPKALATVATAAGGGDDELKDHATQALGGWLDTSAAPVLLGLATSEGGTKYGVRGMRAYIRLIRQFSMPDAQRAAMCRTALKTATRDAERKLVLEVLQRYPSIEMLRIAVEAGKTPSLKNDAAAAALMLAEKIGGSQTDVKTLLEKVGHDPVKIEILKAEYGAGRKLKDVTAVLRQHVRDFPLIVLPSPSYNTAFGGDPARRTVKVLKVRYRINGKQGEATFPENATILLPVPR